MVYEVKGFHTCRAEGTREELHGKVPFLSRPKGQWLGQGYYFWTEIDYWAHKWIEGEKVISEYDLSLPRDQLLDLVGSLQDQFDFLQVLDMFRKGNLRRKFEARYGKVFTVSDVIHWLRDEKADHGLRDIFPYWAVKAKDAVGPRRVPFKPGHCEELLLLERHQMCVYAEHKEDVVTFRRFVYPEHFMDDTGIGELA